MGVLGRAEARVRPAEAQRHAEALRGAHRDVRAELARRTQQRQRQEIRRHDGERAGGVDLLEERREIIHAARGIGILHERTAVGVVGHEIGVVAHHDLDANRLRARLHERDGLRVAARGNEEAVAGELRAGRVADRVAHMERLGGGRGLVEQRGVGDVQAGELGHHRLEVQQHLHSPLRDLGLVGRVGGIPAGILQDVPLDHRRDDGAVVALANEGAEHLVLGRQLAQFCQRRLLAEGRRKIQGAPVADRLRHRGVHQSLQRGIADEIEHLDDFLLIRPEVPAREGIQGRERVRRRHRDRRRGGDGVAAVFRVQGGGGGGGWHGAGTLGIAARGAIRACVRGGFASLFQGLRARSQIKRPCWPALSPEELTKLEAEPSWRSAGLSHDASGHAHEALESCAWQEVVISLPPEVTRLTRGGIRLTRGGIRRLLWVMCMTWEARRMA